MYKTRLLIAESETSVRETIKQNAFSEGWECDLASSGSAALEMLGKSDYQLAVIEAELPGVDGFTLCSRMRKISSAPVIFTSVNSSESSRIAGFEAGGNDYILKPLYPRELIARVKNLLSLSGNAVSCAKTLSAGMMKINESSRSVSVNGAEVMLTPKEFDLLVFFCNNQNAMFSRGDLLDMVWGRDFYGTERTVDTHVKSLRAKTKPCGEYIKTVWGYGYRFFAG